MAQSDHKKSNFDRLEAVCRREGIPLTAQNAGDFHGSARARPSPDGGPGFCGGEGAHSGSLPNDRLPNIGNSGKSGCGARTNHFAASARFDGNIEQHHHLVCTVCGKVVDFQDTSLKVSNLPAARPDGFTLLDYSIYFEGHCSACSKINKPAKPRTVKRRRPASTGLNKGS